MKKCPFCGADIEDSARFCLYCMQPLTEKEQVLLRKKKKPQWFLIIAAFVAVLLMLAVFLLGPLPNNWIEPHVHNYTVKNTSSKYLQSAANCTDPAVYCYSCSCGKMGNITFRSGKPNGHTKITIPGQSADCVNAGFTEQVICSDCGLIYKRPDTLPALGHTFVLGESPAVCSTCGEKATITIHCPEFPYFLNDSIRIDGGTCLFRPSSDGSWIVRLKLTCTNVSSATESYTLAFHLGDGMSTHGGGILEPHKSRVTTITNHVTDPNGTYDLVFVEG